jgi:hypothetical protein
MIFRNIYHVNDLPKEIKIRFNTNYEGSGLIGFGFNVVIEITACMLL